MSGFNDTKRDHERDDVESIGSATEVDSVGGQIEREKGHEIQYRYVGRGPYELPLLA
jgi:hypothetical protein